MIAEDLAFNDCKLSICRFWILKLFPEGPKWEMLEGDFLNLVIQGVEAVGKD